MKTSRRGFVIKSAMAAAGVAYGYQSVGAVNPLKHKSLNSSADNEPAKICIFSRDFRGVGYDEMSAQVAAMGFDGIDLTVRPEGHVLPENVERDLPLAFEAAKKAGTKIIMITTDIFEVENKYAETILKTASALGIKYYRMGRRFYDEKKSVVENLEDFKTKVRKLVKLNQKYNIRGEYQNHSGNGFGAPVWDLWEVFNGLDPKWIRVQYDLFHATVEGAHSWIIGFNLLKPYIGTLDMKDFYWKIIDGKWDQYLTHLGEGMLDYKKFMTLLKENNMRGPFSIHCEYVLDMPDLKSKTVEMKKDLIILRGWLKEAGL